MEAKRISKLTRRLLATGLVSVVVAASAVRAGPLEEFYALEEQMADAQQARLQKRVDRTPSDNGGTANHPGRPRNEAPPADPRLEILARMDRLAATNTKNEHGAVVAHGAFYWSWSLDLDVDHLLERFRRFAEHFPDAPEIDELLEVVPDAARAAGRADAWAAVLHRLYASAQRSRTRSGALLALGRLYLAGKRLPEAREAFAKLADVADEETLIESARGYLHEIDHLQVGMEAPDFSIRLLARGQGVDPADADEVTLKSFRGKVVLLDFWASWCAPCIAEIPRLKAAASRFSDKPFVILSISLDDDRESVLRTVEAFDMPGVQTWDPRGWDGNEARKRYNVQKLPAWFVIDPQGIIRHRDPFGEALHPAIESALARKDSAAGTSSSPRRTEPPDLP